MSQRQEKTALNVANEALETAVGICPDNDRLISALLEIVIREAATLRLTNALSDLSRASVQ